MTYPPQGANPYGPPAQGFPAPQPAYGQPAPPVDKQIHGQLVNVEQRNGGWYRFHIMEPGKQYPVKVDTKKQETVQQAMSLLGQMVGAEIREQPSQNINPNNNRPYVNRYLNAIAPAGFAPGVQPNVGAPNAQGQPYMPPQQPQPAQPQWPQPTHSEPVAQPMMGIEKEVSIVRQAAAKVVAMSWQTTPKDTNEIIEMIQAAEVWVGYFMQGPLRFGVTPFNQPSQPSPQPPPQHEHQPGGGSDYNPGYAAVPGQVPAAQADIFGAPMDPNTGDPLPTFGDPGREDGDPGPGY